MDLQVATQGEHVPAECLSRNVITHRLEYVHGGDFTLLEIGPKGWANGCDGRLLRLMFETNKCKYTL